MNIIFRKCKPRRPCFIFLFIVDEAVHVCHRHLVLGPHLVDLPCPVLEPSLLSGHHNVRAGAGPMVMVG